MADPTNVSVPIDQEETSGEESTDLPQAITESYGTGVHDQPGFNIGGRTMRDRQQEYNAVSPTLTGGDVDAAWDQAESAGDEAVGGSTATPDKSIVDEAWPGDVIGLYDTGNFKIGDTLTEGEKLHFKGIPSFSPEIFKELINKDPMKTKQLEKGIRQLTDEGVAQLFVQTLGNRKIVGTVGELQFEVIQFRLSGEYGASCEFQPKDYYKACWFTSDNKEQVDKFMNVKSGNVAFDKENRPVYLSESAWMLQKAQETYPDIKFHFTSEFKEVQEA